MRIHMSNPSKSNDWTQPAAMAIPKEGYFTLEQGRYGATYPRTPACHGFTIIAKIKPGTEGEIRAYGKRIEDTIAERAAWPLLIGRDDHEPARSNLDDAVADQVVEDLHSARRKFALH